MSRLERLRKRIRPLLDSIKISLSPNRSSRGGVKPNLVVIHTTESGPGSLWGVVNYFMHAGTDVSSTYVVGDERLASGWTEVVMCVPEREKPWTQKSANPYSISYEMIGRASRSREAWLTTYWPQVRTVAALVAEDCLQYGIPVTRRFPGILGHVDLDRFGFPNDHWDPGPNFPWGRFFAEVRKFMADPGDKPEVVKKNVNGRPRPKGIPRRIPKWAWRMREWHLKGRRGKRPTGVPLPLPRWFWHWLQWSTGSGPHGKRL